MAPALADFGVRIASFVSEYLGSKAQQVPFGGRAEQFEILDRWLDEPSQPPRMVLCGPAGRGKSALLTRWMASLHGRSEAVNIIFFPVSARFRTNLASIVFPTIARQLAALHGDQSPAISDTAPEILRSIVTSYLSQPLPDGQRLLLIIDGIDEAADWDIGPDLFPPLPPTTRVVLSARLLSGDIDASGWLARLGWDRRGHAIATTLEALSASGVAEVLRRTDLPTRHLADREDVVAELHRLSEGDPLLVRLYVQDLWSLGDEAARFSAEDLHDLRPGLEGYFTRWWDDQRRIWGNDAPMREPVVQWLLSMFSCAMGPIFREDLPHLMPPDLSVDHWLLEHGLRVLSRLVIGDGVAQGFALSHPRLGQYFFDQLAKTGDARRHEQLFIDWGCVVLDQLADGLLQSDDVPNYLVQYFRPHLQRAGCGYDIASRLLDPGWLAAWERLDRGSYVGFLGDFDFARTVTAATNSAAIAAGGMPAHVDTEIRCSLIRSSIASLTSNIPPGLLVELVRKDVWSLDQGLAYLERLPDVVARIDILGRLARVVHPEREHALAGVLDATMRRLTDGIGRAKAIRGLISPTLPTFLALRLHGWIGALDDGDVRDDLLELAVTDLVSTSTRRRMEIAVRMATSIGDADRRLRQLRIVESMLPTELIIEPVRAAMRPSSDDPDGAASADQTNDIAQVLRAHARACVGDGIGAMDSIRAVAASARQLPDDQRHEPLKLATAVARTLDRGPARLVCLIEIASCAPPQLLPELIAAIRHECDVLSPGTIARLTQTWSPAAREMLADACVDDWQRQFQAMIDENARLRSLTDFLTAAPTSFVDRFVGIAQALHSPFHRCTALTSILQRRPDLGAKLIADARHAAHSVPDLPLRARLLATLSRLPISARHGFLEEAITVARLVPAGSERLAIMRSIVERTDSSLRLEALLHEVVMAMEEPDPRSSVSHLARIRRSLPESIRHVVLAWAVASALRSGKLLERVHAVTPVFSELAEADQVWVVGQLLDRADDADDPLDRSRSIRDVMVQLDAACRCRVAGKRQEHSTAGCHRDAPVGSALPRRVTGMIAASAADAAHLILDPADRARALLRLLPQLADERAHEARSRIASAAADTGDAELAHELLWNVDPDQIDPEVRSRDVTATLGRLEETRYMSDLAAAVDRLMGHTPVARLHEAIQGLPVERRAIALSRLCRADDETTEDYLVEAMTQLLRLDDASSDPIAIDDARWDVLNAFATLDAASETVLALALPLARSFRSESARASALRLLGEISTPSSLRDIAVASWDLSQPPDRAAVRAALRGAHDADAVWDALLASISSSLRSTAAAHALTDLVSELPDARLPQAVQIARELSEPTSRAAALTDLAARFSGPAREELLHAALTDVAALDVAPQLTTCMLNAVLSTELPGSALLDLATSRALQSLDGTALSDFLDRGSELLPKQLLLKTIGALRKIGDGSHRATAILGLVTNLPQAEREALLCEHGLEVACQIPNLIDRAMVLGRMSVHCAEPRRSELQQLALDAIRSITDRTQRAQALRHVSTHLHDARESVLRCLLDVARTVVADPASAEAIVTVAGHLPASLLPIAWRLVATITDHRSRTSAICALAACPQPSLFENAYAAIRGLHDGRLVTRALGATAGSLAPHELFVARHLAWQTSDPVDRALSMFVLAIQSPEPEPAMNAALDDALRIPSSSLRAGVLAQMSPFLSDAMLSRCMESIPRLLNDVSRARVLSAIAPRLPEEMFSRAVRVLDTVGDEAWRAECVRRLACLFPDEHQGRRLAATRAIQDGGARARGLHRLARSAVPAERRRLLNEALDAVSTVGDKIELASLLAELAPVLPDSLVAKALSVAAAVRDTDECLAVLVALAGRESPDACSAVLAASSSLIDHSRRARLLCTIVPVLPLRCWPAVIDALCRLPWSSERTRVVCAAARYAPDDLMHELVAVAWRLGRPFDRLEAIGAIASRVAPIDADSTAVIVSDLRAVEDESYRMELLRRLLPVIPTPDLGTLFELLAELESMEERVRTMRCLIAHLPPDSWSDAVDFVHNVIDVADQVVLLAEMSLRFSDHREELASECLATAQAVPRRLLRAEALVEAAVRQPEPDVHFGGAALRAVAALPGDPQRASALMAMADALPTDLGVVAADIARSIGSESERARVLATLAPFLVQAGIRPEALIEEFTIESHRLTVLCEFVPLVDAEQLMPLLRLALGMAHESNRCEAAVALGPRLGADTWPVALASLDEVRSEVARARALSHLAPFVPATCFGQFLAMLGRFANQSYVTQCLSQVELVPAEHAPATVDLARSLRAPELRIRTIALLHDRGVELASNEAQTLMLEALRQITAPREQVDALLIAISVLDPNAHPIALDIVEESARDRVLKVIDDTYPRPASVTDLADLLALGTRRSSPHAFSSELSAAIRRPATHDCDLGAMNGLEADNDRLAVIERVRPPLAEDLLERCLDVVLAMKRPEVQLRGIVVLAPCLTPRLIIRAMTGLDDMPSDHRRSALNALMSRAATLTDEEAYGVLHSVLRDTRTRRRALVLDIVGQAYDCVCRWTENGTERVIRAITECASRWP